MDKKYDEIKSHNPWKAITVDTLIRCDGRNYVLEEDKGAVEKYNKSKGDVFKFHLEIPPEPWQGNPLKARVIILSQNPGYVDSANRLSAMLLDKAGYGNELCEFKNKVLHLEAESFMPVIEEGSSDEITLFDTFNLLGDGYWVKMLRELKDECRNDGICENEFYRRIALVEYCPYTSERYSPIELPSMEWTKELIKAIKKDKEKLFVVMRGEELWKTVLDTSESQCIVNKHYRCQYLSKGNLGKDVFNRVLEAIKRD